MKVKYWGIVAAVGLGLMLLCDPLREVGLLSRTSTRGLVIAGATVFLGGMIGIIAYGRKHPPLRCPACGQGIDLRHVRCPGGGLRITGREAVQCPCCGAMFMPWQIHHSKK